MQACAYCIAPTELIMPFTCLPVPLFAVVYCFEHLPNQKKHAEYISQMRILLQFSSAFRVLWWCWPPPRAPHVHCLLAPVGDPLHQPRPGARSWLQTHPLHGLLPTPFPAAAPLPISVLALHRRSFEVFSCVLGGGGLFFDHIFFNFFSCEKSSSLCFSTNL